MYLLYCTYISVHNFQRLLHGFELAENFDRNKFLSKTMEKVVSDRLNKKVVMTHHGKNNHNTSKNGSCFEVDE